MTYPESPRRGPKWLIPLAAIAGLLLIIFYALGMLGGAAKISPGSTPPPEAAIPANAQRYTLSQQTTENNVSWQGTVRSRLIARLAPKLNARILEVRVHPGDQLKKGDIIALLDDRDLHAATHTAQAGLMAAQAQAAQAESEARRIADLYQKQAATRQNYDAVMAQAKAARALANQAASAVQQTQVQLGENTLTAPFNSVVLERLQEPGDMGAPNVPLVSVRKPDDLRLEAAIASQCASKVHLGMPVSVRVDVLPDALSGHVDEIAPEIDPQTRTQVIKIKLPANPALQDGQYGWLQLSCSAQQNALLIPRSAIIYYGQLQAVKVVTGNTWQIRHVRTGKAYGERVEVLSGLRAGETILHNAELPL